MKNAGSQDDLEEESDSHFDDWRGVNREGGRENSDESEQEDNDEDDDNDGPDGGEMMPIPDLF